MITNCPNCNAVLSYEGGLHCDYCGTRMEPPRNSYSMTENVYSVTSSFRESRVIYDFGGNPVYWTTA